jgi:methionyl-tRNA formyltransferase
MATLAPKVKPEEGQLLTSESASMTYDRFRGMTPAPGAFLVTKFGRLKVKEMALGEEAGEQGVVLATKPALVIGWTGGSLHLRSVQAEGKRAMSGTDFANGARLRAGDGLL